MATGSWTTMNISQQTLDKIHEQGYHDLEDYLRSIAKYQGVMYNDVKNLADFYGEDELFTGLVDAVASM